MQSIPEILKKYLGSLLSVMVSHATIIIPFTDEEAGATYATAPGVEEGPVDEVLRLMSEVPGRELLITAATGAYVCGPFNSFVAGPFETEDFKTLIDDGVLIESGRCPSSFVFNPLPPDFSDLNLSSSHPVNIYSPAERAEIFKNCKFFELHGDSITAQIFASFLRVHRGELPLSCETESVFCVAPDRCGMSVYSQNLYNHLCRDRGHKIIINDFKGEFYKQEDQN